jgi:hypothetical protein
VRIATLFLIAAPLARAQDPIPDPIAFFNEVKAHQGEMDAIRENYTFHRIRQTEEVDKKGSVTKTTTAEREIFFVNGYQVGRLIKRNGVELSPPEEKKEQARVKKVVEMRMKSAPGHRVGRIGPISEILAVSKISNPRRVSLNGRDTIAFDFTGDPQAHAHNMEQNATKKMGGAIWFDEADRQVARMEEHLDDNFRIGGGLLASVKKGTNLTLEQSPVGQGLWMQTASEEYIAARLVVKGFRLKVHIKDFDFRKFNVETLQQIGPPSK